MTNVGGSFALPPALSLDLYKAGRATSQHHVAPARKGAPWSDEEHKAFLNGLKMYGRGQWKQISRYFVPSRTPTQVASHAQKHFLRQSGAQKRRSRFSAVEEAAHAAPSQAAAAVAHHSVALPPLGATVPGLYAPVGPAATGAPPGPRLPYHLLQAQQGLRLAPAPPLAPGSIRGGIALGTPIGVLPPLPSITTASGTELPILPVLPGRINALTASAAPAPPALPATSYSGDSEAGASRAASPAPVGAPSPLYAPSGRSRQLLRLLELNEQMATADRGSSGSGAAAAHSHPGAAPGQQQPQASVRRVPSATAALDTLASLAEAEAQSDDDAAARAASEPPGSVAAQRPAQTPLVSAF